MRLSVILLVAVAFVASLGSPAAASDGNTVVAATNAHESITSTRFLRAPHEDKYPIEDTREEEDSDDENESNAAEERGWFGETSTALSAFKKLVSQSGDDLVEAVSNLSKSEFNALFNQGKSQLVKMVPGFHPGMDLHDFGDVVRAARNAGSWTKTCRMR
ncbi:hypothetical protein P3T76_008359 [Phytophthora citrophthora]|uniref:RxLR effector protein n=1 Tax=Phytophthora citrophthora TaxID=4793 RepID=A0AAD9GL13_9STRA|nr:hypothetical protein P3T76_008359 [Phytophthora citrophthora]